MLTEPGANGGISAPRRKAKWQEDSRRWRALRARLTHVSTAQPGCSYAVVRLHANVYSMNAAPARSGLCWFGATVLAVSALGLVLSAMEVSAGVGWSMPGYTRLALAGAALAAMVGLMSLAFRIERQGSGRQ